MNEKQYRVILNILYSIAWMLVALNTDGLFHTIAMVAGAASLLFSVAHQFPIERGSS